MEYDEENQRALEGEARATAFHLAHVLAPVTARLEAELEAFDLLSATPADAQRRGELETLLAAMQAYCETVGAYNDQLLANLEAATATMQREAGTAAFFKRQFALTNADLVRQRQQNAREYDMFQSVMSRFKPAA